MNIELQPVKITVSRDELLEKVAIFIQAESNGAQNTPEGSQLAYAKYGLLVSFAMALFQPEMGIVEGKKQ